MYKAIFQTDGNLVVYRGATALWHSHTYSKGATRLVLQNDGNFVSYVSWTDRWRTCTASMWSSWFGTAYSGCR